MFCGNVKVDSYIKLGLLLHQSDETASLDVTYTVDTFDTPYCGVLQFANDDAIICPLFQYSS